MGIKEDPGACKTTPFARMITAKNFKVLKRGSYKTCGCRFRIWYLDSGSKALKAELESSFF